ncbi:helix-turn-helix domain-containing protein [Streptomyces sp. NPDC090022]|uniref:helix-turn-helix domain-containing protein n=1 Tax=Streptomyces sp. NPDC090022 TaxID=3365920 RepID=UPI0037F5693D
MEPHPNPRPVWARSDDVLKLHRLAHTGGSDAVLRWLAARLQGWVGIMDGVGGAESGSGGGPPDAPRDGHPDAHRAGSPDAHRAGSPDAHRAGSPDAHRDFLTDAPQAARPDGPQAALAARAAAELAARGVRSAVVEGARATALLFALDEGRALAAVLERPYHPGAPALLADAAVPLALVLRAEEAGRRTERAATAESRAREAVLHLLMNGRLSTAHQIAEVLTPSLPDPMRMYVVECRTGDREAVTRACAELTGGRAWVVRCPVYVRHLIVFVPTGPAGAGAGHDPLARALVGLGRDCTVGASEQAHLRDAPASYTQAFHALAVARGRDERHARFGAGPELALAAHGAGTGWAAALLAPLHAYEPRRPQDPGAQELRATAHAWLDFTSHATRLLKIHRNTLATRLRHIEGVLGLDLARLGDQAALSLALRLTPGGGASAGTRGGRAAQGVAPGLDDVLRAPALADWSRRQLRPLTGPDAPPGARETVRAWLRHDAHLVPAAAALGISVPAARKRLTRIEGLLERSLLQAPSARHDLWLAQRAEELAGPVQGTAQGPAQDTAHSPAQGAPAGG